jgi:hypothetical protein
MLLCQRIKLRSSRFKAILKLPQELQVTQLRLDLPQTQQLE